MVNAITYDNGFTTNPTEDGTYTVINGTDKTTWTSSELKSAQSVAGDTYVFKNYTSTPIAGDFHMEINFNLTRSSGGMQLVLFALSNSSTIAVGGNYIGVYHDYNSDGWLRLLSRNTTTSTYMHPDSGIWKQLNTYTLQVNRTDSTCTYVIYNSTQRNETSHSCPTSDYKYLNFLDNNAGSSVGYTVAYDIYLTTDLGAVVFNATNVSLTTPLDNVELDEGNIVFNFTAIWWGSTMENCTLWTNSSGTWASDMTIPLDEGFWCYQETANESHSSDSNCALNYTSGNYTHTTNYLYINYTKPSDSDGAKWRVKHGNEDPYNVTIPDDCWSQSSTIRLRFYSFSEHPGGDYKAFSWGECWNGTVWSTNITKNESFTSGGSFSSYTNEAVDGSWSTHGHYSGDHSGWKIFTGIEGATIYEEAILWNITSLRNNTMESFPAIDMSAGDIIWNVECIDNYTTSHWNESNFTLTLNDTTAPYFDETPTNMTFNNHTAIVYEVNATDADGDFDTYWINESTYFQINDSGYIDNQTNVPVGNYSINVSINDTKNNDNSTVIWIDIQDGTSPSFTEALTNMTFYNDTAFLIDVNMTDNAPHNYSVNDSTNFVIDGSGILTNNTNLVVANFSVTVTINDTSGNSNSTTIWIDAQDGTNPYFLQTPTNMSFKNHTNFIYELNETDNVGVTNYTMNESTYFTINASGYLQNQTIVPVGNYSINITINDSGGNENTTLIWIDAQDGIAPYFDHTFTNQSEYNDTAWTYDINASDNVAVSYWETNDTNFNVSNTTGIVMNTTELVGRTYSVNITIYDAAGYDNSSVFDILVNTNDAPIINSNTSDPTVFNTSVTTANWTINVTDPENSHIPTCNFTLRRDATVIFLGSNGTRSGDLWRSPTFNTTVVGIYNISANCSDNNTHSANVYASLTQEVQAGPEVDLTTPLDGQVFAPNVTFNYSASIDVGSEGGIVNCTLWTNATGTWTNTTFNLTGLSNSSQTLVFTGNSYESESHILWNIICYDNGTTVRSDWGGDNRTVMIDVNNPPTVTGSWIDHDDTVTTSPTFGERFKVNATITDSDGDAISYAELTLVASNGSTVINQTNGTRDGNNWVWDWHDFPATSPSGIWIFNITAADNNSATGRNSSSFTFNNSNTHNFSIYSNLADERFNNYINITFRGNTYDYNFSSINITLLTPSAITLMRNNSLTNITSNIWHADSYVQLNQSGTWIMQVEYSTFSGNPLTYSETFSITDDIHNVPTAWVDSATAENNHTFQTNISLWIDTNESEHMNFTLTMNDTAWWEKLNTSLSNVNINNSLNSSTALVINLTIMGNSSMKVGEFNGTFSINRTDKGDNNISRVPITFAINPPAGNIIALDYLNESIECNTTDACNHTTSLASDSTTSKIIMFKNNGGYALEDCYISISPTIIALGGVTYTDISDGSDAQPFDLAEDETINISILWVNPPIGDHESHIGVMCDSSNAVGDNDSILASNQPLIKMTVTSPTGGETGGGGGGGGAGGAPITKEEIVNITKEIIEEEKKPVKWNLDEILSLLFTAEGRRQLLKEGGFALILIIFLIVGALLAAVKTEQNKKKRLAKRRRMRENEGR